nr:hypothetical protein [Microctonus hyperodae filamentous virus]
MRRQQEAWTEAERRLQRRGLRLIKRWENVAHAVDLGNLVKQHCRRLNNGLEWYARGNILRNNNTVSLLTDDAMIAVIDYILLTRNDAHRLAEANLQQL